MSGTEVSIPWSDKLQEVMTAISRMSEAKRAASSYLLVARQMLVLLKMAETPTLHDVVIYVNIKEPAASNFSDPALLDAAVQVAAKLQSASPMDVLNL